MTTGSAKTQMTLLESMRDDAKRLRDVLSDDFNRLFADAKPTTAPLESSAITEDQVRSSTLMCAPSLSSRASMPPWHHDRHALHHAYTRHDRTRPAR
jgi:hypothetical protein